MWHHKGSFSEKLSITDKMHLQNPQVSRPFVISTKNGLMNTSAALGVLCLCQLISSLALLRQQMKWWWRRHHCRRETIIPSQWEISSVLIWRAVAQVSEIGHYWEMTTQAQPLCLFHHGCRNIYVYIYVCVYIYLSHLSSKMLSTVYTRNFLVWSALLLNCNYLPSFFFSFLLFWPIISWGVLWCGCLGILGFCCFYTLALSYAFCVAFL